MDSTRHSAARMSGTARYPWTRHWVPLGSSIDCGWQGDWFYRPSQWSSLATSDLLSRSRLLVLLGNGGMGKSIELSHIENQINANGEVALRFRATELSGQPGQVITLTDEWRLYKETGGYLTIIVDGIDEALPYHPDLLDALTGFFRRNNHPKLRAVLCLRSGTWDGRRHSELFRSWDITEDIAVHEICPLRQLDLELAFRDTGHGDPADFIEWIQENGLGPLARTAIHVESLIHMWFTNRNHRITASELRDYQISTLLREVPERIASPIPNFTLPDSKLEALAELVAVHAILSGFLRLQFDDGTFGQNNCLDLRCFIDYPLNGRWKSDGQAFDFKSYDLKTLLDRQLFARISGPAEIPSFAFVHQTFAERLAGRCLERQSIKRLLRMFGAGAGGRIAPQMEALAATLISSHRPLAAWMLDNQPEILLKGDGLVLEPEFRAQAVLRVLESSETTDENRRFDWNEIDPGFACPEVSAVVNDAIQNKNLRRQTRLTATTIAERCPNPASELIIWQVFNDESEENYFRSELLAAWLVHAKRDTVSNLGSIWQVAKGEVGPGRSHDRSDALRLLLKIGVPVKEILPFVPQSDENSVGSLEILCNYEMPGLIGKSDLIPCLEYLTTKGPASYGKISKEGFAAEVYRQVINNLEQPAILEAFSTHWWEVRKMFHVYLSEELQTSLHDLPADERRRLVIALMHSPNLPEKGFTWRLPLDPADFEWIVKMIPEGGSPERGAWLQLVNWMWFAATEAAVPSWLVSAFERQGDDFKALFPRPSRARSFEETLLRFHRAAILRTAHRDRRYKKRVRPKSWTRKEFTEFIEKEFHHDPISGWARFANRAWNRMAGDEERIGGRATKLLESPGWKALSKDGQSMAHEAARRFLVTERSNYQPGYRSTWDEAGYQAIDLLESLILSDMVLANAVSERWIDSVVHHFNDGEDRHQELVGIVKSLSPSAVRRLMVANTENAFDFREWPLCLNAYRLSWNRDDSNVLTDLMLSRMMGSIRKRKLSLRTRMYRAVVKQAELRDLKQSGGIAFAFHFLTEVDETAALYLVDALTRMPLAMQKNPHPAVPLVLLHALLRSQERWEITFSTLQGYKLDSLKCAFKQLILDLDHLYLKTGWLNRLSAVNLTQIYKLLDRIFPEMAETESARESHTSRDSLPDFEETIRRRLSTLGAVDEIIDLIRSLGCERRKNLLRWHLQDARRVDAEQRWVPPRVGEISKWLQNEDSVLVRTGGDLKQAVLASLFRFQDVLGREDRYVLDCWERQKDGFYRPIHEENLSQRITDFLKQDLQRVVVSREEELRLGVVRQRTDIRVSIEIGGRPVSVIIEHKRAHNTGVMTNMKDQLIERYLIPGGFSVGIYLVSWFDDFEKTDEKVKNCLGVNGPGKALEMLASQAEALSKSSGFNLSAFVLECAKGAMR